MAKKKFNSNFNIYFPVVLQAQKWPVLISECDQFDSFFYFQIYVGVTI